MAGHTGVILDKACREGLEKGVTYEQHLNGAKVRAYDGRAFQPLRTAGVETPT